MSRDRLVPGLPLFKQLYAIYSGAPRSFDGCALFIEDVEDRYWIYGKKAAAVFNESGEVKLTMLADFDDDLAPQDVAIAAILSSEIAHAVGVKDTKSIESELIAYVKPVFALMRGFRVDGFHVCFGFPTTLDSDTEGTTPAMLNLLEACGISDENLPKRLGWGWAPGSLKRVAMVSDSNFEERAIFPPQGEPS